MKVITKIKLNDFREQTDDMTSVTIGYWKKNLHVEETEIALKNYFAHDGRSIADVKAFREQKARSDSTTSAFILAIRC